jgi:hypothetical protein
MARAIAAVDIDRSSVDIINADLKPANVESAEVENAVECRPGGHS